MRFSEQKFKTVGIIGSLIILMLGKTLRIKILGDYPRKNIIFIFWHGKFFPFLYIFRGRGIAALVSQHRDGEFLTHIIKKLRYDVVRGSSENIKIGTIRVLANLDSKIAITPDGPKGERCKIKKGFLKFAKLTGYPIVAIGVGITRKYEFHSWDKFNFPLPFSRCIIKISNPVNPDEIDKPSLEALLNKIDNEAEGIAANRMQKKPSVVKFFTLP